MLRIRILSALTLIVSLFSARYSFQAYTMDQLFFFGGESAWWMLAGILCGVFTISATMILFLACFAITPEVDGSFSINKSNLYGRVFLKISQLNESRADDVGFCRTFWQTNAVLWVYGMTLGVVIVVGALKSFLYIGAAIVGVVAFCAIVFGAAELWTRADKRYPAFHAFSQRVESLPWGGIFIVAALIVFGGTLYLAAGFEGIIWMLKICGLVTIGMVLIIGAFFATEALSRFVFKPLSNTQFGYMYKRYVCPRIKIQ